MLTIADFDTKKIKSGEVKRIYDTLPKIKAVCFDFGGVFELYPPGKMLSLIAQVFGIAPDDYTQEYFKINHLTNLKNQKLEDTFIQAAARFDTKHQTNQGARDTIRKRMAEKKLNTELISWLKILRQQGFKTGILSNYTTDLTQRLKNDGLYDLLDTVVVSSEIGYQKPDPRAFAILFERLQVLPQETIFIDDTSKSLETAKEVGYHPILFKNNEQLKKDLQGFGIEL